MSTKNSKENATSGTSGPLHGQKKENRQLVKSKQQLASERQVLPQQKQVKAKAKKAKVAESKPDDKDPKDSIVAAQAKLPRLVPPAAPGYNLNKRILADIYVRELTHSIYHLWLDCLYDAKVTVEKIYAGLAPVLGSLTRKDLSPRYIYIVASKSSEDEPSKPAGSCFILLPNALIEKRSKHLNSFHIQVVSSKVHMFNVNVAMLRQQLKDNYSLIFSEAYEDLLDKVPLKYIESATRQQTVSDSAQTKKKCEQSLPPASSTISASTITPGPSKLNVFPSIGRDVDPPVARRQPSVEKLTDSSNPQRAKSPLSDVKEPLLIDLTDIKDDSVEGETIAELEHSAEGSPTEPKFVPVTHETLNRALKIMEKFEEERRSIAVVFDPCFFMGDIGVEFIRAKFKPIFGVIHDEQILIRTNMPHLMQNLVEAYSKGVKPLNQAYIIGEKGLSDNEINRRAAALSVFCCPMTMGCVINNLKRGVFLMSSSVLLGSKGHNHNKVTTQKRSFTQDELADKEPNSTTVKQDSQAKLATSNKRNRIAASLNGGINLINGKGSSSTNGKDSLETNGSTQNKVDVNLWKSLLKAGNTVVRIDNLPAKLTIQALNLMMGTFSLKSNQIVASRAPKYNACEIMDVRVVIHSNNDDLKKILSKDKCRTAYDTVLHIEQTNWKELRQFLLVNHKNLTKIDTDDRLPINRIGYSNGR